MTISVIIPVYNGERTIKRAILSLKAQTRSHELIIINDGSTDKTAKILDSIPDIKCLKMTHQGPGAGRNLGAANAVGDILVFVDADMEFDANFLERLVAPIESHQAIGTWTKEEYVSNMKSVWARCWNLEYTNSKSGRRIPPKAPDLSPVYRAILKSEFNKVNGFGTTGYTDDWTLSQKLNTLAVPASGAIIYHENPSNLSEIKTQTLWVAKRQYKFGELGRIIGFIRALAPFSLIIGIVKAIKFREPFYLVFKLCYDFFIIQGMLDYWTTKRLYK